MSAIEKRGENSYRLTVSCGYDKNGKKLFKRKTIDLSNIPSNKQLKEAERLFILFKEEVEKGTYLDAGKISFEEFVEKWFKDYAEVHLAPKTLHEYRRLLKLRIIPCLGHLKLNKIQPTHLNEFYNLLREDGIRNDKRKGSLSENSILHYHRIISSILTAAVQWQFILQNPAERIKAPRIEKKEAKCFNLEEIEYILDLMNNEPIKFKTLIYLAVFGGMRMGELCGLEWKDIDFDSKLLNIHQASQYLPGKGIYTKQPKTCSGNRTIALPDSVINMLKEYKAWYNSEKLKHGNLWVNSNRVFTKFDGSPMFPTTPSKWFRDFIKKHNSEIKADNSIPENKKEIYLLPEVNFHGLRHTSASLLISSGVDIVTVSKRLGHSKPSVTTDIYAHSLRKADTDAAEKFDDMFKKKCSIKDKKQG